MKYKICKFTERSKIDGSIVREYYQVRYKLKWFWRWAKHTECDWSDCYKVIDTFKSMEEAETYVHDTLYPRIVTTKTITETTCSEEKTI